MKKIALSQRKFALVDDEDFEELNKYKWYANKHGNTFYVARNSSYVNGKRKAIRMHHQIIGYPLEGFITDHRNGCALDNQRSNLRHITCRQNQQNQHIKNKSSQYPGVHWCNRAKRWITQIKINGKKKYLGNFKIEFDAFQAYKQAVKFLGEKVVDF